ncbi:MAG: sensor histidine kinase [Solirubrobacteraceae bacterium]
MLFYRLDHRLASAIRTGGLILIDFSVVTNRHHPATSGRGLLVALLLVACNIAWVAWTVTPMREDRISVDVYVLAVAGGVLIGAAPNSAASAFVFVAVVAAALRVELDRALAVVALGALALGIATLMYNNSGVGLLAYTLGFAAAALAGSNSRQSVQRAEQAELLVAQTQRSQEEHVRAARLEESARIAREIHDVLAHALAGLTIQLEATSALLEQGADREAILARVQRAHALAREGLQETRRAVGALREDGAPAAAAVEAVSARAAIEALVEEYRTGTDAPAELMIDGDPARLAGPTGQTVQRIVQEALTNVRKHAPGAAVSVSVHAGEQPEEDVVLRVDDRPISNGHPARPASLAASGGGYGLQGMRERAQLLGGTLDASAGPDGWRVELRLPPPGAGTPSTSATPLDEASP